MVGPTSLLGPAGLLGSAYLLGPSSSTRSASAAEPNSGLPPAVDRPVDFAGEVVPLLKSRCFACHAGQAAEAGYRLDVRIELLGETNGEPLVVLGRSAESRLIQRVASTEPERRMPPPDHGPTLTAAEVSLLRGWIDQRLPWDDKVLPPLDASSDHWSFQPVRRPATPSGPRGSQHDWPRTPIDAFIAAEHEKQGIRPNEPTDRRRLARRAALSLTGLPPDPDALDELLRDDGPDAFARFVDRLLASPRHGERWGRHWLDVARWAESEGYESNHLRPYAWRYRDYVVRSFNHDRPYDQFLRQQLAGDELTPYGDENLIATGFLAAARLSSNEEDKKLQRIAVLNDIVSAVGESV
ncbi:MAG TPA: DUF1549 domain-containing protein, partial [Pirellulaceae bacterium]|nr:DUF1549 domain-containing protein [Pirellulaceae bacterium]